MIPCIECICLAICKQKMDFKCSILYDFMDDNIRYDMNDKVVNGSPSYYIWKEVHEIFQKEEYEVRFCKKGMGINYTITSKNDERDRHEGTI